MIPSLKQWSSWSLPSKLTAIGTLLAVVSLCLYAAEKVYTLSNAPFPSLSDKLLVFSGSLDSENGSLKLQSLNSRARIQFINYFFPHKLGPFTTKTNLVNLTPVRNYLKEKYFEENPYGSLLFFAYSTNPNQDAERIIITDFDGCDSNPKLMHIPINSGIPLAIESNYILDGKMYQSLSLYHIYFEYVLPVVDFPYKKQYPEVVDVVVCCKSANDIVIRFKDAYFIQHLNPSDRKNIEDILVKREKNLFERAINDYAAPIKE